MLQTLKISRYNGPSRSKIKRTILVRQFIGASFLGFFENRQNFDAIFLTAPFRRPESNYNIVRDYSNIATPNCKLILSKYHAKSERQFIDMPVFWRQFFDALFWCAGFLASIFWRQSFGVNLLTEALLLRLSAKAIASAKPIRAP
jgi:hypothetical protein